MANSNDSRGLGGIAPAGPQSRYILPSFIEHSSFGVKESNPYNKLFEERIIFLGAPIDDVVANDVMRSEERRVGKECRSRWSPYH